MYLVSSRTYLKRLVAAVTGILFLLSGLVFVTSVQATAGDGTSDNLRLQDTNGNGKIDRILFDIQNPNSEIWSLKGIAPHGLSATQGGNDITISSVAFDSSPAANPVTVRVNLDETDTDLVVDTEAITTNALELVYTQETGDNTCTTCLSDSDEELNTIATGDTGTTDSEIDAAAPALYEIVYEDNTNDGMIDQIVAKFSEPATGASSLSQNDLVFGDDGDFDGAAFGAAAVNLLSGGETEVTLVLGTEATVIDTSEDSGLLSLTTQNAFLLSDGTNTNSSLGVLMGLTITDGAAPIISQFGYRDAVVVDGMVDQFSVTFSEAIAAGSVLASNDLTLTAVGDFTDADFGNDANNVLVGGETSVNVSLGTASTVIDTFSTGGIAIATQNSFSLTDGTNVNNTLGVQTATIVDEASPFALSSVYQDTSGNGQVDQVVVSFSDDNGLVCAFEAGDFTFPTAGTINITAATGCATNLNDLTLSVTADAAKTGGAISPTITYTDLATANSVVDGAGNDIILSALSVTDQAAPTILSARYLDFDTNGAVDQVTFTTSADQGIACTSFTAGADFTVNIPGTVNLVAGAGDTCATNGTDTVTISLITPGTAATTGGLSDPLVNYNQPGDGIEDAAGNDIATTANISVTDGASPVSQSATYLDTNNDGQVDRIDIIFTSDNGLACTFEAGDWTFPTAGTINVSAATGCNVTGNTLELSIAADASITGGALNPQTLYTDNGVTDQVVDGALNDIVVSNQEATDAAGPAIVSAIYQDNDTNAQVDRIAFTMSTDTGIACTAFAPTTDFTVATNGTVGIFPDAGDTCTTNGTDTVFINLGQLGVVNTTGGAIAPIANYFQPGNGIEDGLGNDTPSKAGFTVNDGASPISQSATYLDTNTDGSVDRLDIVMSADTGFTCAIEGTDWTFPTAGTVNVQSAIGCAINSNTIELSVIADAAKTGGASDPTITYTDQGVADQVQDGSGNDVMIAAQSATDMSSPVILSANYTDANNDGEVDQALLMTSSDTGITCTTFTAGVDFTVTTPGTVNLATAAGDTCGTDGTSQVQILLATPGTTDTTGGAVAPVIQYTQPGNGIEDGAGNDIPSTGALMVGDMASPVALSAEYKDINTDGQVDRFDIVFTTDLGLACAFEAGDWSFPTNGDINTTAATNCSVSTNTLLLSVTSDAAKTGGAVDPTVTYTDLGVIDQVQDASGNDIVLSALAATDKAAPIATSAEYRDTNGNGSVNRFFIRFSDDTGLACTFEAGDWSIPVAGDITANTPTNCNITGNGKRLRLFVSADANETGGAVDPTVLYTNQGTVDQIVDAAGNATPTFGAALTVTDDAKPISLGAEYLDTNTDGTVDRVDFTFTTETGFVCTHEAGDWTFPTPGSINISSSTGCNVVGTTIQLNVSSSAGITGGITNPTITYTDQGSNNQVQDNKNNDVVITTQAAIDKAAPVALSSVYRDTNTDGQVDQVDISLSQDNGVTCTFEAGDFSFTTAGTVNLTAPTGCTINGNTLELATTGNANITGGATNPIVAYTDQGTLDQFQDAAGNDGIVNAQNTTDATSPIALSAIYQDVNADGTVDRMDITFTSENSLSCAFEAGDYTFPTAGSVNITAATGCNITGNTLELALTATTGVTGGAVNPTLTYTDQGVADQLIDAAGNDIIASTITATDMAAPVILSSQYIDNNTDGAIDRVLLTTSIDTGIVCNFNAGVDFTVTTAGEVGISSGAGDTCTSNATDTLTITLGTAGTANTTGGLTTPVINYTQPGNGIEDAAGNDTPTANNLNVSDAASPIALSSIYLDTNLDGQVDRFDIAFTADTGLSCTLETSDWTFPIAGSINASAATSCNTTGNTIQLGVTADTAITGGITNPATTYTDQGIADQAQDGAGNDIIVASIASTDSASPVALSSAYKDTNTDGQVDRVDITFSADSGLSCAFEAGDWTFPTAGDINLTVATACTISGNDIQLSALGDVNETGGATNPTVLYTDQGTADQVQDGSGNDAVVSTVAVDDAAAPIALSAAYKDTNLDGTIDRFDITLTPDTGVTCNFEAGDWTFPVAGTINTSAATSCAISGNDVQLGVTTSANITGGIIDPTVSYTDQGIADQLTDGGANDVIISNQTVTDATSPVILSGVYQDNNTDGAIDRVLLTLTADTGITCSSFTGNVDFVSTTAGEISLTTSAGDTCSTNGTSEVVIGLATLGTADTTGGATSPVVNYIQPTNGIEDGGGNDVPSSFGLSLGDNASPIALTANFFDTDIDGTVDQVGITFTADTGLNCTHEVGDFTFPTPGSINLTNTSACSTLGNTMTLAASGNALTTGGTTLPTLLYTDQGVADQSQDGAGNDVIIATLTVNDLASVLVISQSPTPNEIIIDHNQLIVVNFTEPVNTGTFTINVDQSPFPLTDQVFSNGNATFTTNHLFSFSTFDPYQFTITGTDASANTNALLNNLQPLVWSTSVGKARSIQILNEEGQFVDGENHSGTKVVQEDGTVICVAEICGEDPAVIEELLKDLEEFKETTEEDRVEQNIEHPLKGKLVKSASSKAVYYVSGEGKRHVFVNANVYYSWYNDFSGVITVPDQTLITLTMGAPVPYKPGLAVKTATDPKVYLMTGERTMRHIANEEVAEALLGSNWSQQIIDIDVTEFTMYKIEGPIIDKTLTIQQLIPLPDIESEV